MVMSQPKSRRDGEQKIKLEKIKFGVVTIVYFEKLQKTHQKEKTRSAKRLS